MTSLKTDVRNNIVAFSGMAQGHEVVVCLTASRGLAANRRLGAPVNDNLGAIQAISSTAIVRELQTPSMSCSRAQAMNVSPTIDSESSCPSGCQVAIHNSLAKLVPAEPVFVANCMS